MRSKVVICRHSLATRTITWKALPYSFHTACIYWIILSIGWNHQLFNGLSTGEAKRKPGIVTTSCSGLLTRGKVRGQVDGNGKCPSSLECVDPTGVTSR
ncbi:uncharacterized protein BO95DRAFT_50819 [Aspergillus brunneoviolaceus CBS 621.78]|uniref:Uncharacterized protein n=1 Tax=Aspergillus brunneoviolaceus CBS 621.78 TaxID=1450534 RepID=A0ACD1GGV8_9EURO|nr:hypothetical protein BO95DRAFT_50819 [Aspergillus brunneoviolaceus CBS 621.78]RAH48519.1 hypothetical protein BO95DRAFT_50819 [Aspergillus brunneoviolaceus CBS 621.78]